MSSDHTPLRIIPITIEEEIKTAFIDYSMSVIVARALPDVRDGLKPVHRRVLYAMDELGLYHDKRFKKSATVVGEVLGKYHPHGDSAIYDTMVRMAQPWSLRYPLVEGQGNFGSQDGDAPASIRYTEARLARISKELLADLSKETVDFQPNYDDSLKEPQVLPSKIPNLLLNGSAGIAVGMATNMAPHNLRETVAAIIAYIEDPAASLEALAAHMQGPDFPTGGLIYGHEGIRQAFHTGKGRIVVRARAEIETNDKGRERIIVTQIPYMVNKAQMIEKTAELIQDKKLAGISDIRDESDKDGLRIVYEIKKEAIAQVVLNHLYKHTALQSSFSVNNVALVDGRPQLLNLKQLIHHYVVHRHEVFLRKTRYEHKQAAAKLHLLEGYLLALDNVEQIVGLIKAARDSQLAKAQLMQRYSLSEVQAKAILEMRLQRLTGLERDKITQEHAATAQLLERLNELLADKALRMGRIKEELRELQGKYGDARRTEIVADTSELGITDLIPNEPMVITVSHQGYIKRTPLTQYKTQRRGGVGSKAAGSKKEDFAKHLFISHTHDHLLIFTQLGKVYWKRVYEVPEGGKNTQGRAIQNLIEISSDDRIRSVLKVPHLLDPDYVKGRYVVFATEQGLIKKTPLQAYTRPRTKGISALLIRPGDRLLEAKLTQGENHLILALRSGKAVRFPESEVRSMGRNAAGVRGITLAGAEDRVVGMVSLAPDSKPTLLVVAEQGYGKRSRLEDYRLTRRGGKGIKTLQITPRTGSLVAIKAVSQGDQLMIINTSGIAVRIEVAPLRVMRRATQGVRLLRLQKGDSIAAVATIRDLQEKIETKLADARQSLTPA